MDCKFCGTKNAPKAAFCKNCGRALTRSQATAVDASTDETAPAEGHRETRTKRQANAGKRLARRGRPWGFITAGVILMVAVGGDVYYQNQKPAKPAVTKTTRVSRKKGVADRTATAKIKTPQPARSTARPFPKAAVQQVVDQGVGALGKKGAIAVMPVSGSASVIRHNRPQRAASVIKLFILATVYQKVAAHELNLDETYRLQRQDKVGGTGTLQTLPDGSDLTYREITKRMIDESDNTAANIMIDAVGGMSAVNDEITRLGLTDTKLARRLMDTDALRAGKDNYTSVKDVATLLRRLYNHQLVSKQADRQMLAILKANVNHTKLPHDLPSDVTVYNKTGEFNQYGVQNDAAIFKNKRGAVVVVALSQDGQEQSQVTAMNQLGAAIYQTVLAK